MEVIEGEESDAIPSEQQDTEDDPTPPSPSSPVDYQTPPNSPFSSSVSPPPISDDHGHNVKVSPPGTPSSSRTKVIEFGSHIQVRVELDSTEDGDSDGGGVHASLNLDISAPSMCLRVDHETLTRVLQLMSFFFPQVGMTRSSSSSSSSSAAAAAVDAIDVVDNPSKRPQSSYASMSAAALEKVLSYDPSLRTLLWLERQEAISPTSPTPPITMPNTPHYTPVTELSDPSIDFQKVVTVIREYRIANRNRPHGAPAGTTVGASLSQSQSQSITNLSAQRGQSSFLSSNLFQSTRTGPSAASTLSGATGHNSISSGGIGELGGGMLSSRFVMEVEEVEEESDGEFPSSEDEGNSEGVQGEEEKRGEEEAYDDERGLDQSFMTMDFFDAVDRRPVRHIIVGSKGGALTSSFMASSSRSSSSSSGSGSSSSGSGSGSSGSSSYSSSSSGSDGDTGLRQSLTHSSFSTAGMGMIPVRGVSTSHPPRPSHLPSSSSAPSFVPMETRTFPPPPAPTPTPEQSFPKTQHRHTYKGVSGRSTVNKGGTPKTNSSSIKLRIDEFIFSFAAPTGHSSTEQQRAVHSSATMGVSTVRLDDSLFRRFTPNTSSTASSADTPNTPKDVLRLIVKDFVLDGQSTVCSHIPLPIPTTTSAVDAADKGIGVSTGSRFSSCVHVSMGSLELAEKAWVIGEKGIRERGGRQRGRGAKRRAEPILSLFAINLPNMILTPPSGSIKVQYTAFILDKSSDSIDAKTIVGDIGVRKEEKEEEGGGIGIKGGIDSTRVISPTISISCSLGALLASVRPIQAKRWANVMIRLAPLLKGDWYV